MEITTAPTLDIKTITSKTAADKEAKLQKACKDFEAIFIKQMLTTMRKSVPKSGLFNDGFAKDMYQSMADDQLAKEMAHSKGIRIVLDAVINHTGPVTDIDPVWPKEWVRTGPTCEFKDYESTITCTLVKNLPDILTESDEAVELPPQF